MILVDYFLPMHSPLEIAGFKNNVISFYPSER